MSFVSVKITLFSLIFVSLPQVYRLRLGNFRKMSKKIKNLKWESVAVDGFPASMLDNFQGFVGLEECTDYGLDKQSRRSKKNKQTTKRKNIENINPQIEKTEVPKKKIKLSNGFTVELCKNITPSTTNEEENNKRKKNKKGKPIQDKFSIVPQNKETETKLKKIKKPKLGESTSSVMSNLTSEDMLSWAEFKLPDEILKALMELGFKNPTKIQQLSLPAAIHGRRDILGAAETGSGKTLAFGLPILSGIMKLKEKASLKGHVVVKTGKPLYALILTPTRELAIQISRHLIAAAKYTGIKVATIVGGMAAVKQERVLKSGPEIVVATPGRLWELLNQGQPHLQQLPMVKFLAIDETDRMIERGHFDELQPLLERLNSDESHKNSRQNFVFSATLTLVHDLPGHMKGKKVTRRGKIINRKVEKMTPQQKIKRLINMIGMTDPKVVDITTQNLGTAETLTECRIACSMDQKDAYLYYILKRHPGRTIVFCNSIGSVKRLAQLLSLLKCQPLPLHANMPQRQRLKNLERFRDDPQGVLVATDVAARGLDIPDVDHVIHYQVPKTAENYVHRSGRTARATKEGLTILMMEPAEAYNYAKLCRTLNKTSEIPTFPVQTHSLSPVIELVKVAREMDALLLKKRRGAQAQGWRERVAREMDIIIDDDDIPVPNVDPTIDKVLRVKKRQFESLLARPLFPKGFSFKYPTLNDPNALQITSEENALQVMKNAIESGKLKKEKRKGKNDSLLKLEKAFKKTKEVKK
ncbi:ATP-dependent RNA helicase DDX24 [Melitaea cinxia]|uniref:ATP-dependent RNA helicase DDX24 n=1 Tax=Melitaea cinxia TaxID=113334 RepID=UPI001E26F043|nr:ATP-dependent RNA helicase DDX24 [Melitaea cinxia]